MKTGLTINELAAEIMRQKDRKEDYIVSTPNLRMETCGSDMLLRILDEDGNDRIEPLDVGPNAHRQIATHLSIPTKYYAKMQEENPELLSVNVNSWFMQPFSVPKSTKCVSRELWKRKTAVKRTVFPMLSPVIRPLKTAAGMR